MRRWERIVDQLVRDAIGDGDISQLPGAGKPLNFKDDAHTPADKRAAFKIMQDHEVIPDWIAEGKTLEQREEELRQQIASRAERHRRELQSARAKGRPSGEANVKQAWNQYVKAYAAAIERHNRQTLLYNLKVPDGIPHRQTLNSEALIKAALQA